jgi:leucine efflux protein
MSDWIHLQLGVTDFWSFVVGTVLIVLLPGPNSVYVLSVSAQRGVRAGYRAACGVFLGDLILMLLSAGGVASLLRASPELFGLVKWVGGAYLGWIGLQMLRGAWRLWQQRGHSATDRLPEPVTGDPFARALVISLLNPKAILFFVSFFIQFVDPTYPAPWWSFGLLGLVCELTSCAYLTVLILVGARLAAEFRRRRRLSAGLTGAVGALFIGFGAKLATASL